MTDYPDDNNKYTSYGNSYLSYNMPKETNLRSTLHSKALKCGWHNDEQYLVK